MSSRAKVLKIAAWNVIVLVVGLACLELYFGGWLSPSGINRLNVPRAVTWEYEIDDLYPWPRSRIHYTRNAAGLRGVPEGAGEVDILTVGGSTTDQRYIEEGHTWQDAMQAALARHGYDVEIANAGIDGQSSFGHLRAMEEWFPFIPGLEPRYVLFFVGLNDFYRAAPGDGDFLVTDLPEKSFKRIWYERSAIMNLLHAMRTNWQIQAAQIGHQGVDFALSEWTETRNQSEYESWAGPAAMAFGDRIRALAEKVQRSGATAVFVTQPARYYREIDGRLEGILDCTAFDGRTLTGVDFYHVMEVFNRSMERAALETSSLYVDMMSKTREAWEERDFYDYAHMTPHGARKVGQYLADWFVRNGLFP